MSRFTKILLVVFGTILAFAAGLVIYATQSPLPRTFHGDVKELLPSPEELAGWTVEYRPIADTPEVQAKVAELLNYDSAVFAIYTRGATRVSIYLAYWTPGKMMYRDVGGHTPDNCWVNAGWKIESAAGLKTLTAPNGACYLHTEHRVFTASGAREHMLFWHIVGGVSEYWRNGWPPPMLDALTDLPRMGRRMRAEQFFVRISSNVPVERWESEGLLKLFTGKMKMLMAPPTGIGTVAPSTSKRVLRTTANS